MVQALIKNTEAHVDIIDMISKLYTDLFNHDGYGELKIEMRILRRGQKEIIIHCGKQYRYVINCDDALKNENPIKALLKRDILS